MRSSRRIISIILILIGGMSLLGSLGVNQTAAQRGLGPVVEHSEITSFTANSTETQSSNTTSTISSQINSAQTISSNTTSSTNSSTSLTTSTTSSLTSSNQTNTTTGPSISFDSSSGQFGSTVNLSGSDFSTNDTSCSLSGDPVGSQTCMISNGVLTGSFTVANTPPGSFSVTAAGSPVGDSAYATFTVIGGTPSITLDSQSGSAGNAVQVSGTFFSVSDSSCTLTDDGSGQNETCSISAGAVTASFIIADVSADSYTITVTGSPNGDWASQTFNVTSSSLSISLNETSAPVGAAIQVSGSGFTSSDSNCTLSGDVVSIPNCSLASGELSGSFMVANVTTGSYMVTATGSPSGDSTSANFTVASELNSVANGTAAGPDFSMTSSPSVTLTQGGSGEATINVTSLNGFSSNVTLSASWVGTTPDGVNLTLTSPVTPAPDGAATASLTITASSNASTGTFALQVAGTNGSLTHVASSNITVQILQAGSMTSTEISTGSTNSTTSPPSPTSCAVSSATSGSALAPLAETLRGFRDQSILKTRTGAAFMTLFNSWYYSFSPPLALHFESHQTQRTMFRYGLYPLMGILYASYYSYLLLSPLNNELAAVTAGLVGAGMIGLVYVAPTLCLVRRILWRKAGGFSLVKSCHLALLTATSGIAVGITYFSGAELALGIATVSLILSTLTLGAILGIQVLSRSDFAHPTPQIAALRRAKWLAWHLAARLNVRTQRV